MKRQLSNYITMIEYLKKNGFIASCGRIYEELEDNVFTYKIETFIKTKNDNSLMIDIYNNFTEDKKEVFNITIDFKNLEVQYNRKELILILNFIKKAM